MIAFIGLVFAATLLTVSFGTATFSTRILRTFQRDIGIKACLGIFIATFFYTLAVANQVQFAKTGFTPTY